MKLIAVIFLTLSCKCFGALDAFDSFKKEYPTRVGTTLDINASAGIEGLDFRKTDWQKIPQSIGLFRDLRFLRIRGSRIQLTEEDIGVLKTLKNLQYLEVSGANVGTLRVELGVLDKLTTLLLSGNQIRSQSSWPHFENLQILGLAMNKLGTTNGVGSISSSLKELDLSTNELEEIVGLEAMRNLNILLSSHNKLRSLPLLLPRSIEILDLSSNRISNLPAAGLAAVVNLRVAILADNLIEEVPGDIIACNKLQIISLVRNKIKALPKSLLDIPTISRIDLAGNPTVADGRIVFTTVEDEIVINF